MTVDGTTLVVDDTANTVTALELNVTNGLTVDGTTLVVDDTANTVSVGTAFTVATPVITGGVEFDASGRFRVQTGSGGAFQLNSQDNSETLPTYAFRGDGDTGWWTPGADIMAWSTNGAERMRLDASGLAVATGLTVDTDTLVVDATLNTVSVGSVFTAANSAITGGAEFDSSGRFRAQSGGGGLFQLDTQNNSEALPTYTFRGDGDTGMWWPGADTIAWSANGGERMRLTTTGLGIGTTSPADQLHLLKNSGDSNIRLQSGGASTECNLFFIGRATDVTAQYATIKTVSTAGGTNGTLAFCNGISDTERMRIDSSGNLLVGRTSTGAATTDYGLTVQSDGVMIQYANVSGTAGGYVMYDSAGAVVVTHRGNGGIANFQANDVNLSDERAKKDIVDSSDYLDRLCQIPVRNFRYKHEDAEGKHHLGVIAQEVEAACPELVSKESWEYEGEQMDSVHSSDLMYAMLKAIQELKAEVEALKNA